MARLKGGIESMISGKIGGVVFVQTKWGKYARSVPTRGKKRPWSPKQVMARKRFSAVYAFWKQFQRTPFKQIWDEAAEMMSGYNFYLKTNMPAFGEDGALIDPERLHFSAGKLPLPHRLNAKRMESDPTKIEASWQNDEGSGVARPDDELMMMVSNDGKFIGPIATGAIRRQETAVIQLPAVTGTIQGIYLFFGSDKRKLYSPDIYLGI
jgi:hypothetical protein